MRLSATVTIKNRMGLHTRPATEIVKLVQNFKSQVSLVHKTTTADGRSILGILMLAAARNTQLTINVEGEDAELALHKLLEVFEKGFGEGE